MNNPNPTRGQANHDEAALRPLSVVLAPWLRRAGLVLLIALLLFVQLPMLWMVITAFRTKGTAFRLNLLPERHQVYPGPGESYTLPRLEPGMTLLHVEVEAPGAGPVRIEFEQPPEGDSIRSMPMQPLPPFLESESRWTATLPLRADQPARYRLLTGEGHVLADPRDWPGAARAESWLMLDRLETGFMARPDDRFRVYAAQGQVEAAIAAPEGTTLDLGLGDERRIDLAAGPDGVFRASAEADGVRAFRIVERLGLGEAFSRMYTLDNFRAILTNENFRFGQYVFNSVMVALFSGLFTVIICTMAGYAFAVKQFHFRDRLFQLTLASMLIPGMIFMVPQFAITLKLGWMNSYQGMIVPHLANVFGLFLVRQYVKQIPADLFAAAEIDGASELNVFRYIVIPICLPIMVTLFLLVFVTQWSNFLWQLIVNTGDSPLLTLPVGLQQFKGQNSNDWERIMAGACFSILPIALLFVVLQRYFLQGLTAGAVKG